MAFGINVDQKIMEMIGVTKESDPITESIWEEDEEVVEPDLLKLMQIFNEEYSENSYIKRLNTLRKLVEL